MIIRCTDSAMLSQEPAQGVYKSPMPCSPHHCTKSTVMSCQIIQNEQHAQGRVHAIQLLRCRKRVPILPPSPFWDLFWREWTRLENGGKFLLQPGVQDGVRALINGFSSQFPGSWSKQCQHLTGLATNVLMILGRRHSLWLPRRTGMRNGLIRTCLIFTPQG